MSHFCRSMIVAVLLGVVSLPVHAHTLPDCVHTHLIGLKQFHTCTPNNVACAITTANTCKTQRSSIMQAARWCRCIPPASSCFAAFTHAFITSGAPSAFDTKLFSAASHEANETTLFLGEDVLIDHFGAADIGFGGTFLLEFGSFQDPLNVLVEILDATLSFPSFTFAGVETGTHNAVLSAGASQFLHYDSTTGILNTVDDGILFDISSALGKFAAVPVFLEGEIDLLDDDATTLIIGQFTNPAPDFVVFLDNFEFGDTRAWSNTVRSLKILPFASMSILGLGTWAHRRRRRHAEP